MLMTSAWTWSPGDRRIRPPGAGAGSRSRPEQVWRCPSLAKRPSPTLAWALRAPALHGPCPARPVTRKAPRVRVSSAAPLCCSGIHPSIPAPSARADGALPRHPRELPDFR